MLDIPMSRPGYQDLRFGLEKWFPILHYLCVCSTIAYQVPHAEYEATPF